MAERQKLSEIEEGVLIEWCLQLYRWGWPAKVNQLRSMASELLKAKGDTGELGINWQGAFFTRWLSELPWAGSYESQGLKRWAIPTRPKDHDSRLR